MKELSKKLSLFLSFVIVFTLLQSVPSNASSTWTITFNKNTAGGTAPASLVVNKGSSATLPTGSGMTSPGGGRIFAGWSSVSGAGGLGAIVGSDSGQNNISFSGSFYRSGASFTPTGDITLYGTWTSEKYIFFQANGGSGTPPGDMTAPAGTSITLPAATGLTKAGSCFDGWKHTYDNRSTNTYNSVFVEGDSFNNIAHYVYFTAQWLVGNCSVSYNGNGSTSGSVPSSVTIANGSSYTIAANPGNLERTGFVFQGWSTTPSGSVVASKSITGKTIFYASWLALPTYAITFNSNGGTGSQTASSWVQGASARTLPTTTTFIRTGFSFVGWAASASSLTQVLSYGTAADVTFYAIWSRNSYSVTFNKNSDTATGTMAIETRSATTALPSNEFTWDANNTFQGWNTLANGSGTPYANGANYLYVASTTLYAQWGKTISYSNSGADSGSPSRSSDSWSSGAITLPTAGTMVKAGYTFGGWTANGVATLSNPYTPTTGITLNPVWTPNTYTISFNKNGVTTSGTVPSNQTWVESSTALTLSGNTGSLTRTGYTFGGWSITASAPQTAITTFATTSSTLTHTLYAIWTPVSYSVTYALDGGTSTLPTEGNKNINNTFTIAAAPTKATFIFGGWSDGSSIYAAGATYTVRSSNITLTAQWIPTFTVRYLMNGSSTTPDADVTTTSGTVVVLAAEPTRTGYTFAGWLDNLPTPVLRAAGSNFTVIQDSTLQARWTPVAYTVTYALASGTSAVPTQANVNINNTFTTAATPTRPGYMFTGWSDATNTYGAGAPYVVGSSNITLTAQWSAISYTVTYDLGGGTGTLPTKSAVNIGDTFIVSTETDPTRLAHTFVGWNDGDFVYAKTDTYTVSAKNIVLTAVWNINGSTQITYALGGGSGTLPIQAGLLEGSNLVVASGSGLTRDSFAFGGWNDGADTYQPGSNYYVGPDTSPITLTAFWTAGYSITYESGTATGTVPVDATPRASGTSFSLASGSSLSKSGYTFAGWNDGTTTYSAGASYTVGSSNVTLTAVWTVVVVSSGGSSPDVTPVVPKIEEKPKDTVREITKETKSTESPVVAVGVEAIADSKKFDSFFKNPTTPVVSPITSSSIVVVSANTSVNTQGVTTTSDKPVTIPITLANPIITNEVARALVTKVVVESSATSLKITAVAGFTGVVIVPIVATVGGVQTTVLNRVVVSPVLPVAKGFTPVDIGKSSIAWQASPSQVVSYEVAVNGKIACTTKITSCPLPALIGPNTKVTVSAIGNDETNSGPQVIPYAAVKPIPALKVNFNVGSAVLATAQKKEIVSIAKVITTQGFTRLVVNGFTDATGSPALNAALSKARANSVVTYMKTLLPKVAVKAGANGAAKPIANNATDDGRAQNRRTEIATW